VVLRLRQQVLALPGFDGRAGQVVLHPVSLHGQVLEVPWVEFVNQFRPKIIWAIFYSVFTPYLSHHYGQ
jgi:hypothetical protein